MSILPHKKTYLVAAVAACLAFAHAMGYEVPEWVYVLLSAIGLGTMRAGIAKIAPKAAAVLMCAMILGACATSQTGAQEQDTSQGTVTNTAWGGVFGHYRDAGKGSKRTVTAPVLDRTGQPVLDDEGKPLFTTIVEDGASGPLVLNYGTVSANIEQSPQGEQAGSGTQGKTDTSTPGNDVSPPVNLSGFPAPGQ